MSLEYLQLEPQKFYAQYGDQVRPVLSPINGLALLRCAHIMAYALSEADRAPHMQDGRRIMEASA